MDKKFFLKNHIIDRINDIRENFWQFEDFLESGTEPDLWDIFEDAVTNCYNNFYLSHGVNKGVIIFDDLNYVVKIPFEYDRVDDFCSREVEIYNNALMIEKHNWKYRKGISHYFAPCEELTLINGIPIYIMEKAEVNSCECSERVNSFWDSEKSNKYNKYNSYYFDGFNEDDYRTIVGIFQPYCSDEELNRIVTFCQDYGIFDIHSGNIGFINGMPVIIDYSGCC